MNLKLSNCFIISRWTAHSLKTLITTTLPSKMKVQLHQGISARLNPVVLSYMGAITVHLLARNRLLWQTSTSMQRSPCRIKVAEQSRKTAEQYRNFQGETVNTPPHPTFHSLETTNYFQLLWCSRPKWSCTWFICSDRTLNFDYCKAVKFVPQHIKILLNTI